jgi:O-antigen biosynthesis protein
MPTSGGTASASASSPGAEPSRGAPPSLDVVVPVHGAPQYLSRCADSLLRSTDWHRHRLVLAVDGPQEPAVEAVVARLEDALGDALVVSQSTERRGFSAGVNRGLAVSDRDVVLLNADTEVSPGWADRLAAAAGSAPDVATVTPFTNHGTICSLPRFLAENTLPAGHDVESFAGLVAGCAEPVYPELPTGVGFCLLVRRRAVDAVGTFDEEAFGLGYGEETDFCERARRAGLRHLLADDVFVYHRGGASFGRERERRVRRAQRVIGKRYPDYLPRIADFLRRDPLAPLRERVLEELRGPRPVPVSGDPAPSLRRVLHVVHGWPPFARAGTESYAHWLAYFQARRREVAAFARIEDPERPFGSVVEHQDGPVRVRLTVQSFDQRNPLTRNGLRSPRLRAALAELLDSWRPDLVHVHHLAGHAFTLPREVTRRGLPLVVQLQDWWTGCARVNLLHADGSLCSGPGLAKCSACRPLTGRPPVTLNNLWLHALRRRLGRDPLRRADALVAGSRFLADGFRQMGWLPRGAPPVRVLPYGVAVPHLPETPESPQAPAGDRPLCFGFLGSLMPHKGVHVAVAAFDGVAPEQATLDVWGAAGGDPGYAADLRHRAGPAVRFRGPLPENDKPATLAALDALLMPSSGLESFGLVAREALAVGTPVIASRRGALAELFPDDLPEDGRAGTLLPPEDPAAWAAEVRRLLAEPGRLARWRRAAPRVKTLEEHGEEIEAVYRDVLAERQR